MAETPLRTLAKRIATDTSYAEKVAADPQGEISKAAVELDDPIYKSDKFIYRVVVGALAVVVLTTAIGAIILESGGKTTPQALIALGSTALGALAGLLAPSPVHAQS
jgi:hypothetical protein